MDDPTQTQSSLPLTETTYFILLSLAPGPLHGYAIMKEVRRLSQKRVLLSTGTLYSALKRLLDQGFIQRTPEPEDASNSRGRKSYSLTTLGNDTLRAEVQRLQGLVSVAKMRFIDKPA